MTKNNLNFGTIDLGNSIEIDDATGMAIGSAAIVDPDLENKGKGNENSVQDNDQKEEELIAIPDVVESNDDASASEDSPSNEKDPSSSPFKVLINALHERGVLSEVDLDNLDEKLEDDEANPAEVVMELMQEELIRQIGIYKDSMPPRIKALLDRYEEDVPLEKLLETKVKQEKFEAIKESDFEGNTELQKKVITELLAKKGNPQSKIDKWISKFEQFDDLEDEAKDALKELNEIYKQEEADLVEQTRKEKAEREVAEKKILQDLKSDIDSTESIIDGLKLSEAERKKLYESMTKATTMHQGVPITSVAETRLRNPLEFDKVLHYYHSIGLFNMDEKGKIKPNLDKIVKVAKSSAVDELNKALKSGKTIGTQKTIQSDKQVKQQIDGIKSFLTK